MKIQKSNIHLKSIAILMAVVFLVSLTAVAASAAPPCKGPIPHCNHGMKASCVNGNWRCLPSGPVCKGPIPHCSHGMKASCVNGYWKCVR
jgi:hypothetical protein